MRIVCWQTILMKYHTKFFSKIKKMMKNLSSAAVVIGTLRVKLDSTRWSYNFKGGGRGGPPLIYSTDDTFWVKRQHKMILHRLQSDNK